MAARGVAVLALAALLAGCVRPGPLPPLPRTELPSAMPVAPVSNLATTAQDPWPRWWEVFHDPQLEGLIAEARARNPDLQVAFARVRAARGAALAERSYLWPWLGGSGDVSRQRRGAGSSRVGSASSGDDFFLWTLGLDASWEIDVTGRLHRATEAAVADLRALEQERHAVEVLLAAEVARAWFDLLAARAESRILDDTVRLLEETRKLVEARVGEGVGSELDLRRVEGSEAAARSRQPEARRKAEVASNRLAILLGEPPGRTFEPPEPGAFETPPSVPLGLPSALVRRRPDVRAQEQRVLASQARLAEAIADFYPSVTLAGRSGLTNLDLAQLVTSPSVFYSVGPSIRIPIFEGGRLAAVRFQRLAERDAESAAYVAVVLQAFAEVADAVAGLSARLESREYLQSAVASQRRAVELSKGQYEAELVNYLPVIDSQTALAENRLALLQAERLLREEVIRLGQALGGGWDPDAEAPCWPPASAPCERPGSGAPSGAP